MDFAKYSKQTFESLIPGSPEMQRRVKELKDDVTLALHTATHTKFKEIVSALNLHGHSLVESAHSKVGEIDFTQIEHVDQHVFYLCCDTVISSGYRGTPGYTE